MDAPNIPGWAHLSAEQRACAVLDWCVDNGIDTSSILPYQLAAAMDEVDELAKRDGVEFRRSPVDYVDMVRVIAAFLRSRI